jgi:excinuclease ABC subunit A
MDLNKIEISGAKEHNLKDIDVQFPIHQITCVGGRSGSGKSSLVFSTLFNESKRIFLNSLPTSAQLFSKPPSPAKVDRIHPVLPVIGLKQKNPIKGKKLNVSDLTGAADLLEGIFENSSVEVCPKHETPLVKVSSLGILIEYLLKEDLVDQTLNLVLKKETYLEKYPDNFFPVRSSASLEDELGEYSHDDHYWELTKIKVNKSGKLTGSVDEQMFLNISEVYLYANKIFHSKVLLKHGGYKCEKCDYSSENRFSNHRFFSSFSPLGACSNCKGFGSTLEYTFDKLIPNKSIPVSEGGVKFLTYKRVARYEEPFFKALKLAGLDPNDLKIYKNKKFEKILMDGVGSYPGVSQLVKRLEKKIYKMNVRVFLSIFREEVQCEDCEGIRISKKRFNFLVDKFSVKDILLKNFEQIKILLESKKNQHEWSVLYQLSYMACELGLGHLDLKRKALSLSSSEHQRCLLLNNLSFKGSGCLFVFDEPSLGLGVGEQEKFYKHLITLKENFNTVILIDHSSVLKRLSDYYLEIGPGAGPDGGQVVYSGRYKNEDEKITFAASDSGKKEFIEFNDISIFNLKFSKIKLRKNSLNLVYGPNGSGKTALFVHAIGNYINEKISGESFSSYRGEISRAIGLSSTEQVLLFSPEFTKPSSRSTVATFLGFSTVVRKYFSNLPMAKASGLKEGHFSANSALGQCPNCLGQGHLEIDMHFLESIKVNCEDCNGRKFKSSILSVSDGLYDIHDAGNVSMVKLFERIKLTPKFKRILQMVNQLSLGYLSLDRSLGSLSGGEYQRLRLIKYLESNIENSFIILENMSFGLSIFEISSVLKLLENLSKNNTIIIIDHSEYLQKCLKNQINLSKIK